MGRLPAVLSLGGLLLVGCGGEQPATPETSPAAATAPATPDEAAPPPVVTDKFTAPEVKRWTAVTVADLPLSAPVRTVKIPSPIAPSLEYQKALTILAEIVDTWDADPDNPWAIAHGLVARGPDFTLTNGKKAVPWLFQTYAEEHTVDGQVFVHFPESRGDVRIEPHTDLMLKVLTEIGVEPSMPVTVQGKPHVVSDLYRGSLIDTYLVATQNHASFSSTDDMAWNLQALTTWAEPPLRWTAVDGTEMDLDDLTAFTTAVLISESQFMFQAMQAGADFEKKGQGIFKYTCGGAHLLQGVSYATARGYGNIRTRQAVDAQIPLMFYRLPRELRIYDAAMQQNPEYSVALLVQRLKFTGHFLESMSKLAALGFYQPDAQQLRALAGAAMQVTLSVENLKDQGVFDRLPAIRAENEQLYLDIVGDSAHALHGMELALGRASVRY